MKLLNWECIELATKAFGPIQYTIGQQRKQRQRKKTIILRSHPSIDPVIGKKMLNQLHFACFIRIPCYHGDVVFTGSTLLAFLPLLRFPQG